MTTVGYGDIVPKTVTSKVLLCIFGVVGTGFIALPAVCHLKNCDTLPFLNASFSGVMETVGAPRHFVARVPQQGHL